MSSWNVCNIPDPDFILLICCKHSIENVFPFFVLRAIRVISIWLFCTLCDEPLAAHNAGNSLFIHLNISAQQNLLNTALTVSTFIFLKYFQNDFCKGFILYGSFAFTTMQIIVVTGARDF